jgi:hypothetical protein
MSGLYIVNVFDCPSEEHLAEKRSNGKFYYVHPSLRKEKRYHGMTPENPTPVEDFGLIVERSGGRVAGVLAGESRAVYRDGRPRKWQGRESFEFRDREGGPR